MLDSKYYDKLNRLRLALRNKSAMNMSGNRKSVMKGSSAEFSDFREYIQGDDIRRIDWNAYARLDRLYIKEYMEEKESVISIFIDTSASMCYGINSKEEMAKKITCALSYIALNSMDRVILYDIKNMDKPYRVTSGKRGYMELIKWVDNLDFSGSADLYEAVRKRKGNGTGLSIIISDFLYEDFIAEEKGEDTLDKIISFLNYNRQQVVLIQVLSGEELDINMTGTYNLIDMESDEKIKVSMNQQVIDKYMEALNALINNIKKSAVKGGAFYSLVNADWEFDKIIFEGLKDIYDI